MSGQERETASDVPAEEKEQFLAAVMAAGRIYQQSSPAEVREKMIAARKILGGASARHWLWNKLGTVFWACHANGGDVFEWVQESSRPEFRKHKHDEDAPAPPDGFLVYEYRPIPEIGSPPVACMLYLSGEWKSGQLYNPDTNSVMVALPVDHPAFSVRVRTSPRRRPPTESEIAERVSGFHPESIAGHSLVQFARFFADWKTPRGK